MAEKIVGFRLKLEGEKSTLDALNTVRDTLNQSGKAIESINKRAEQIDKTTAKIKELTKAVEEFEKQNGIRTEASTRREQQFRQELEKSKSLYQQLLFESQQAGGKSSQLYDELLRTVAAAKNEQALLNKEIRNQQREFEATKFAVGSYRELNFQLGKLRDTYKSLSDIERDSPVGREMLKNIDRLDTQLKELDASMGQYQRNVGNYISAFNGFQTITQNVASVLGVVVGLDEIVQNNAQLSDSLAGVQRVANLSQQAVEGLYGSLRTLNTRTSLDDLLGEAVIGGKLGIAEQEMLGFVQATDKLGVALKEDLGGNIEQTAESLGKLVNIFGGDLPKNATTTGDKMLYVGNAIDVLSDSGTASGGFIVDFTQRLAGMNDIAGITLPRLLGMAAAFEANGQTAEVSATATQSLITQIAAAPDEFARLAGYTGKAREEFINLINSNPIEALLQLSTVLKGNNPLLTQFASVLKEAGVDGERTKGILGVLGSKAGEFRTQMDLATKSIQEQTKIQNSYEIANNTAGAALDRFKKSLIDISSSPEFQRFLAQGIEYLTKFVQIVSGLPKFLSENKTEIFLLIGAYLSFNKTLIASSLASIQASTAYQLLTSATERQRIVTELLGKAQRALPLLVLTAIIYGAVKAFQYFNSELSQSEQITKRLADAKQTVNEQSAAEIVKMQQSINTLKSATASYEEKKAAIDALNQQYPDYLQNIDLNKASVAELTTLQDKLTESIIRTQAEMQKKAVTDEIANEIVQTQLRVNDLKKGGDVTLSEAAGVDTGQMLSAGGTRQAVINNLEAKLTGLNSKLIETGKRFDEAFGLGKKQFDSREAYENERDDRSIKNAGKVTGYVTKEEKKERDKAARELKKEEDERIRNEKAAAENIFRIRKELIDKTFEGQKLEAIEERKQALLTLKGNAEQIEEQKKLLDALLAKRLNNINKAYQAEREAALRDIQDKRREFDLRQSENNVNQINSSGKTQNRQFAIQTVKVNAEYDSKESDAIAAYQKQGVFTKEAEKKLTNELLQIKIEREKELQAIEIASFEYNKTLKQQQLQFEVDKINEQRITQLAKLDESQRQEREKLDEQYKNKLITLEEYQNAVKELEAQFETERDFANVSAKQSESELAQQTALEVLQIEQDLNDKKLKIQKDTNAQLLQNSKETIEKDRAMQAARLDFLNTFVSGAKDLLGQDENNRKKYSGVLKALALAEIAINLSRELSAIAVASAANPTNALTFGGAGITQYTIQSATAIARAGFATAKVLTTKYEKGGVIGESNTDNVPVEGGSIPRESGMIQGRSHTEGGVRVGQYEFEGGEYKMRNGNETYIISKRAAQMYKDHLSHWSKVIRPSVFSLQRKLAASQMNQAGGGVKFAQGGVIGNDPVPFSTPVAALPLPPSSSSVIVQNNLGDLKSTIDALAIGIAAIDAKTDAINTRIDRITVINDPKEIYDRAIELTEIKTTQNL